jgi:DNA-binding NarL/FixJ family response regulator
MNIIFVDGHLLTTEPIIKCLSRTKKYGKIFGAKNIAETMTILSSEEIDIAFIDLDLNGENGLDLMPLIRERSPGTKMIVCTMFKPAEHGIEALKAGAMCYITKDCSLKLISEIIEKVAGGNYYLSNEMIKVMVDYIKSIPDEDPEKDLNEKEKKYLDLITEDITAEALAEKMVNSVPNVYKIRNKVIKKLNLDGMTGLIKYALKRKLKAE